MTLAPARMGWLERFGLRPFRPALREARKAVLGNDATPRTEWNLSSTRVFKPAISLPTWLGRRRRDGRVPVYNFFNRVQPPRDAAYSVKVSFCRDFQGGQWTYDSHVGTDFATPVGTPVLATAPGRVLRVASELDHGGSRCASITARACSRRRVTCRAPWFGRASRSRRGQALGWSGASGIEFILFFPWVAPHLHLNVWLDGEPVDPFAREGEISLWRRRNDPQPFRGDADDEAFEPSEWDAAGVDAAIAACRDREVRARASSFPSLERRAAEILFHRVLNSAVFESFPPLYVSTGERRPCLDLPFPRAGPSGCLAAPRAPTGT